MEQSSNDEEEGKKKETVSFAVEFVDEPLVEQNPNDAEEVKNEKIVACAMDLFMSHWWKEELTFEDIKEKLTIIHKGQLGKYQMKTTQI